MRKIKNTERLLLIKNKLTEIAPKIKEIATKRKVLADRGNSRARDRRLAREQ
jgi:hypothetical protein